MPITLKQLESLRKNDHLVVTRTGEIWFVKSVEITRNRKRQFQSVRVEINNGKIDSYFDENRLALFNLVETLASSAKFPSPQKMAEGLRPGFKQAYKSFEDEEGEKKIEKRIEDNFVKEPKLKKPATLKKPVVKKTAGKNK
jgi:hypothetical protein